jgi:CDP-paratose 2-epimerase
MKKIVVTGGAGFIGSNLSLLLKAKYPQLQVIAFDNLKRRGSELNVQRLIKGGVSFIHGDVRFESDIASIGNFDLMIECSAEPSVLSGFNSSPNYMLDTNLNGLINCLNVCKKNHSRIIFLSSSRVYPYNKLNQELYIEEDTRYSFAQNSGSNLTKRGISESYPLNGIRSLYGASKLSAEFIINEYCSMYSMGSVINRCGVIAGPWQFGKVDQGIVTHWIMAHYLNHPLTYIGYGGHGKQVRDILHIDDLFEVVDMQIRNFDKCSGSTFNIGGGVDVSISLLELTHICRSITGNIVPIESLAENRDADLRIYISDTTKFEKEFGWSPRKNVRSIVEDIHKWIVENFRQLEFIVNKP